MVLGHWQRHVSFGVEDVLRLEIGRTRLDGVSNAVVKWEKPSPNSTRRSALVGLREWAPCRKMCKWVGAFQFSASWRIGTKADRTVLVLAR